MRRQRSVTGSGTAATTLKKVKTETEEGNEEVGKVLVMEEEEEEERRNYRESLAVAAEVVLMEWDDQRPRWWTLADEQMSWGSSWCPFWDLDFMGEAYNDLYSDVVWEYDIWNLKAIMEVPNP